MRYILKNWQCFEIDSKEEWGRVRVFAGLLQNGQFHVTGDIVEFDALTRVAGTSLGNDYVLSGEHGLTADAKDKWRCVCEKNGLTGLADVTDEIRKLMVPK